MRIVTHKHIFVTPPPTTHTMARISNLEGDTKSIEDELSLLRISDEQEELKKEVSAAFDLDQKNAIARLLDVAVPRAQLAVSGVDGGSGIASLVKSGRQSAITFDTAGFSYNIKDLPLSKLNDRLNAMYADVAKFQAAEKYTDYDSFSDKPPAPLVPESKRLEGKLTTALGASHRSKKNDAPQNSTALWQSMHDLDSAHAAFELHDYDTHFNQSGEMDWLVRACALYVVFRVAGSQRALVEATPIAILTTAAGLNSTRWATQTDNVIELATILQSNEEIVGPSDVIPDDMREYMNDLVATQVILKNIAANKDSIRYNKDLQAFKNGSTLLLSLARFKRICLKYWPSLAERTVESWQVNFTPFIIAAEEITSPVFIPWLNDSTATQLGNASWVRDWLQANLSNVTPDVFVLCVCFFLDSKYALSVPDNKKVAFRRSAQAMALPLTRSYYSMSGN